MGITYGDHLIDSGHYEMTPEQEREIVEDRMCDSVADDLRQCANEPWKYDGGSWPDKMIAGAAEIDRLRSELAAKDALIAAFTVVLNRLANATRFTSDKTLLAIHKVTTEVLGDAYEPFDVKMP